MNQKRTNVPMLLSSFNMPLMHYAGENIQFLCWSFVCRDCDWLQNIVPIKSLHRVLYLNEWYTRTERMKDRKMNARTNWIRTISNNAKQQCANAIVLNGLKDTRPFQCVKYVLCSTEIQLRHNVPHLLSRMAFSLSLFQIC